MDEEGDTVSVNPKNHQNNGDLNDGACLGKTTNSNKYHKQKDDEDEGDALGTKQATYGDLVAPMPVGRFDSHYNMKHKRRGMALIFNHEYFDCANLKRRAGTEQDRQNLEQVLKMLGFEVHVFQDLRFHEIDTHINSVANHDHTDNDCLLIAVLSHGDTGALYAKDKPYSPEYLWGKFTADNCLSLAGKPKIFFLQACQGDKLDGGVILSRTETDGHPINSYRIPTQADFLVVYSTVLDDTISFHNICDIPFDSSYYSWRNTTRGSWFIQALCEELRKRAFEMDLLTILTFVSQRVAYDYESNVPDSPTMHQQKQVPVIMSRLTRLIQFNRVGSENVVIPTKPEKSPNVLKSFFKGK